MHLHLGSRGIVDDYISFHILGVIGINDIMITISHQMWSDRNSLPPLCGGYEIAGDAGKLGIYLHLVPRGVVYDFLSFHIWGAIGI